MPLVSVIIPVYNVEKYLKECLDSVINQTLKDIEIICVNDGSTDSSPKILEEYAARDNRIKIINKENGGLSSARNEGLKYASAKYIHFLDSDDYIDITSYEKLYNKITEFDADFCQFGYVSVNDEKEILGKIDFRWFYKNSHDGAFNCFDEPGFPFNVTWGAPLRFYNKEYFLKNVKEFPLGRWYEDVATSIRASFYAKKIVCLEEHLYFYRNNPVSIMHGASKNRKCFDIIDAFKDIENILNELNLFNEFEYWFFKTVFSQTSVFYNERIRDGEIKEEFKIKVKEYLEKFDIKSVIKRHNGSGLYEICPRFVYTSWTKTLSKILSNIFSIKNERDGARKVITVFWIKFKVKRKKKV